MMNSLQIERAFEDYVFCDVADAVSTVPSTYHI